MGRTGAERGGWFKSSPAASRSREQRYIDDVPGRTANEITAKMQEFRSTFKIMAK